MYIENPKFQLPKEKNGFYLGPTMYIKICFWKKKSAIFPNLTVQAAQIDLYAVTLLRYHSNTSYNK